MTHKNFDNELQAIILQLKTYSNMLKTMGKLEAETADKEISEEDKKAYSDWINYGKIKLVELEKVFVNLEFEKEEVCNNCTS